MIKILERIMDMDRGQITVVVVTAALQFFLPFVVCLFVQPLSIIIFCKSRADFVHTGIPEALVLFVIAQTALVVSRLFLECFVLLVVNMAMFSACSKLFEAR